MGYVFLCFAAMLAGIVQAVTGFGAAAMMLAVLAFSFDMQQAPAITQLVCTALSAMMLIRYRKHLDVKQVLLPTVIYSVVSIVCVLIAKGANLTGLTIAFGAFLVVLAVFFLFFNRRIKIRESLGMNITVSTLSGALSGLFGCGGPTMALYLVSVTEDTMVYLANMQFLFTVTNVVATVTRAVEGFFSLAIIPACLAGMVAVIGGELVGEQISKRIRASGSTRGTEITRIIVYAFVGVSGLITVLQKVL